MEEDTGVARTHTVIHTTGSDDEQPSIYGCQVFLQGGQRGAHGMGEVAEQPPIARGEEAPDCATINDFTGSNCFGQVCEAPQRVAARRLGSGCHTRIKACRMGHGFCGEAGKAVEASVG